jgi:hypothetical protein
VLSVGAFVGGELYPSWMHFFQALIALSFFICIFFTTSLDEEDTALAWWPELTALPTSIFAEMIGLARDETPFLWPCNQRSLPWFGDQMVAMSYR